MPLTTLITGFRPRNEPSHGFICFRTARPKKKERPRLTFAKQPRRTTTAGTRIDLVWNAVTISYKEERTCDPLLFLIHAVTAIRS